MADRAMQPAMCACSAPAPNLDYSPYSFQNIEYPLCISNLDGFHKFHEQHGVVQQKGVAPPGLVLFYSLPTASLSLRGGLNSSPRFQRSCNVFATVIVYLMNNPGSSLG